MIPKKIILFIAIVSLVLVSLVFIFVPEQYPLRNVQGNISDFTITCNDGTVYKSRSSYTYTNWGISMSPKDKDDSVLSVQMTSAVETQSATPISWTDAYADTYSLTIIGHVSNSVYMPYEVGICGIPQGAEAILKSTCGSDVNLTIETEYFELKSKHSVMLCSFNPPNL